MKPKSLLIIFMLLLASCYQVARFDAKLCDNLEELKTTTLALYDKLENPVEPQQMLLIEASHIRESLSKLFNQSRSSLSREETAKQLSGLLRLYDKHIEDWKTTSSWSTTHKDNLKMIISEAYDILISTESIRRH